MSRDELERLSKQELIELVLRLQRPNKTSRTSSKPPSTDPKQRRERSKPGGAKPGHKGHSRTLSQTADWVIDHRPEQCPCCRAALGSELATELISAHDRIELPNVKPVIERHQRLAVQCPACGARVVAAMPTSAKGTPFGPRLHAVATYLKTFQALSFERLQGALADLFGLSMSQGGLMNMLRRAQGRFQAGREEAVAALRRAEIVACDETSVRIEGMNAYHWVFRCQQAVVHHAAPTRAAAVVREMMDGHRPEVWLSDRYSAQQGHAAAQQTCLAHLARALQRKFRRARDQLLTFVSFPGAVAVTNNACERDLRPAVVQRKVTNGYRAMWAAEGEAAVRTVVDTARLTSQASVFSTILKTVSA
jgi:transposase